MSWVSERLLIRLCDQLADAEDHRDKWSWSYTPSEARKANAKIDKLRTRLAARQLWR